MGKPLSKFFVKAIKGEEDPPTASLKWTFSRRGWIKFFEDRVECGNWVIPFSRVHRMKVYAVGGYKVLSLQAAGESYQFGFFPWADPPFESIQEDYLEEEVRLKYSPVSIFIRVLTFSSTFYIIWKWLQ